MELKHIGMQTMLINSMFIAETNKISKRKFDFPQDIEDYRQKMGLSKRPKEFELTQENYERIIGDKQ